jgi:hypothetical protein
MGMKKKEISARKKRRTMKNYMVQVPDSANMMSSTKSR